jgi:hypothetical protein
MQSASSSDPAAKNMSMSDSRNTPNPFQVHYIASSHVVWCVPLLGMNSFYLLTKIFNDILFRAQEPSDKVPHLAHPGGDHVDHPSLDLR